MSYYDKNSLISWLILAFISLFLWYRNLTFDRVISLYIFTLALVQLIEYGIYSGSNPQQSAKAVYIIMWLECLVLAIGTYVYVKSDTLKILAGWNVFLFAFVFVMALTLSFTNEFIFTLDSRTNYIQYYINGKPILQKWGWLYILGLFIPILLIFSCNYDSKSGLVLLFSIVIMGYILNSYPYASLASTWSYFGIAIAFVTWISGMF